jgi:hypothetical protein
MHVTRQNSDAGPCDLGVIEQRHDKPRPFLLMSGTLPLIPEVIIKILAPWEPIKKFLCRGKVQVHYRHTRHDKQVRGSRTFILTLFQVVF